MDNFHQFQTEAHPPQPPFDSAFNTPYFPSEPPPLRPSPHPHSYYTPNPSALPPLPPPPAHHHHLNPGSSSDSSPYKSHHHLSPHPSYQNPYNSAPTHSDANSSSFESHGSSHSHGGGVPPYVGFSPHSEHPQHQHSPPPSYHHPSPMMPPPTPGYPGHPHCYVWSAPIEYISNIKPMDVLSGRGGATNSHSGNRAFRTMVKQYQPEYLKAKKRDKPSVAAAVVRLIRERGGRFLRRCEIPGSYPEVLYYDIGDRRATEKACQALREGAPVLRAKRKGKGASSAEDDKCTSSESCPSSGQQDDPAGDEKENETPPAQRDDKPDFETAAPQREPIVIRPSARMLRRAKVDPIRLDDLDAGEREIYLKDFLPPNATYPKCERKPNPALQTNEYNVEEGHPFVSV